jgi:hypothetical protein
MIMSLHSSGEGKVRDAQLAKEGIKVVTTKKLEQADD